MVIILFASLFLCLIVLFSSPGPRELTGAVDLITHYKLIPHHEFFCKKSLPVSIADTYYLHNVVGDTEIRKGEGMQLDQLTTSYSLDGITRIRPFDLDSLREAFHLRETTPVELPLVSTTRYTPLGFTPEIMFTSFRDYFHICPFFCHLTELGYFCHFPRQM